MNSIADAQWMVKESIKNIRNPWQEGIKEAVSNELEAKKEFIQKAEKKYADEIDKTDLFINNSDLTVKTEDITPEIDSKMIWSQQFKAIQRADQQSFETLEKLNVSKEKPRPNLILGRIKALRNITRLNKEISSQSNPIKNENKLDRSLPEKIVAQFKLADNKIQIVSFDITFDDPPEHQKSENKKSLQKVSDHLLIEKQTGYEKFRHDPSLQIMRAAKDHILEKNNTNNKEVLINKLLISLQKTNEKLNGFAAKLKEVERDFIEVVEDAVDREQSLRNKLIEQDDTNKEFLTDQKPVYNEQEKLKILDKAIKLGNTSLLESINDNNLQENELDSSHLGSLTVVATAKSVCEARMAIFSVNEINPNTFEVEIQFDAFLEANDAIEVADFFESNFGVGEEFDFAGNLSLRHTGEIKNYLDVIYEEYTFDANLIDFQKQIDEQYLSIGQDLMYELQDDTQTPEAIKAINEAAEVGQMILQRQRQDAISDERYERLANETPDKYEENSYEIIRQNYIVTDGFEEKNSDDDFWKQKRAELDKEMIDEIERGVYIPSTKLENSDERAEDVPVLE